VSPKVTYFLIALVVVYVIALAIVAGFGNTAVTQAGWLILAAGFARAVGVQLVRRRRG